MSKHVIRTAVIPVADLGTRMLPAFRKLYLLRTPRKTQLKIISTEASNWKAHWKNALNANC